MVYFGGVLGALLSALFLIFIIMSLGYAHGAIKIKGVSLGSAGILLVAIGMFFYVPTDIVPLPPDGTIKTVAELTKMKFPNVKIIYDVTSVSISLIVCILFLKPFSFANMSVGIGTVLAAVLVGLILGFLNKWFGDKRDLFIK